MTKSLIRTTCSSCSIDVRVYRNVNVVEAEIPSNGKRGSLHVPAHTASVEIDSDDDDLVTWDCPACGEADSFDLND